MKSNLLIEPPAGLLEKILKRIHKEERFLIFRDTAVFSIAFLGSVAGFFPVLKMMLSDFASSGFLQFFSLIFSDFSSVARYWQSFSIILLETLPAASLVLFLAVLLIFLQSIKLLSKDIKIILKTYGKGHLSVQNI